MILPPYIETLMQNRQKCTRQIHIYSYKPPCRGVAGYTNPELLNQPLYTPSYVCSFWVKSKCSNFLDVKVSVFCKLEDLDFSQRCIFSFRQYILFCKWLNINQKKFVVIGLSHKTINHRFTIRAPGLAVKSPLNVS